MFDWQVIVVACVLLLASAYVGRRGWLRISSLAISKWNAPSCDKACGHREGEGLVPIRRKIRTSLKEGLPSLRPFTL